MKNLQNLANTDGKKLKNSSAELFSPKEYVEEEQKYD